MINKNQTICVGIHTVLFLISEIRLQGIWDTIWHGMSQPLMNAIYYIYQYERITKKKLFQLSQQMIDMEQYIYTCRNMNTNMFAIKILKL